MLFIKSSSPAPFSFSSLTNHHYLALYSPLFGFFISAYLPQTFSFFPHFVSSNHSVPSFVFFQLPRGYRTCTCPKYLISINKTPSPEPRPPNARNILFLYPVITKICQGLINIFMATWKVIEVQSVTLTIVLPTCYLS